MVRNFFRRKRQSAQNAMKIAFQGKCDRRFKASQAVKRTFGEFLSIWCGLIAKRNATRFCCTRTHSSHYSAFSLRIPQEKCWNSVEKYRAFTEVIKISTVDYFPNIFNVYFLQITLILPDLRQIVFLFYDATRLRSLSRRNEKSLRSVSAIILVLIAT